jgi:hypothetical protein
MQDFYSACFITLIVSGLFFGSSFYARQETENPYFSLCVGGFSGFIVLYATFFGV